jgi:hypothetical protein
MRLVLSAAAALSLTACFGAPGEPLNTTERDRAGVEAPASPFINASVRFQNPRVAAHAVVAQPDPTGGETVTPSPSQAIIDEMASTIEFASVQAYAAADAGILRDKVTATQVAIDLANAAALVQQLAQEMQALSVGGGSGDCGCGGCGDTGGGEVISNPDVDNAVLVAALAAQAAGEIASELDPPSTQVCSGGCHPSCETVPGVVDEAALDQAILDAQNAGAGCANASTNLENIAL